MFTTFLYVKPKLPPPDEHGCIKLSKSYKEYKGVPACKLYHPFGDLQYELCDVAALELRQQYELDNKWEYEGSEISVHGTGAKAQMRITCLFCVSE